MVAGDGPGNTSHGVRNQSGWIDQMDIRTAYRLQRICRDRFRDAQRDQPDQAAGSPFREGSVPVWRERVSWHGGHLR